MSGEFNLISRSRRSSQLFKQPGFVPKKKPLNEGDSIESKRIFKELEDYCTICTELYQSEDVQKHNDTETKTYDESILSKEQKAFLDKEPDFGAFRRIFDQIKVQKELIANEQEIKKQGMIDFQMGLKRKLLF